MKDLPVPARLYVAAVLAAGATVLLTFGPRSIENPGLFSALLVISSVASAHRRLSPRLRFSGVGPGSSRRTSRTSTRRTAGSATSHRTYRTARMARMRFMGAEA